MSERVIAIVGGGGHAIVVADALLAAGYVVLCFLEVDSEKYGQRQLGLPIVDQDDFLRSSRPDKVLLANGIGGVRGTGLRRSLQQKLAGEGWGFAEVRHPTAIVSPYAIIGAGVQLLAGTVVQACAIIGDGAIINTSSVVEHDCRVGDWCHVAPAAALCGNVTLEAGCHVGAGAVIREGVRLGSDSVVGAGAVVVQNFAGNGIIAGVPARRLGER